MQFKRPVHALVRCGYSRRRNMKATCLVALAYFCRTRRARVHQARGLLPSTSVVPSSDDSTQSGRGGTNSPRLGPHIVECDISTYLADTRPSSRGMTLRQQDKEMKKRRGIAIRNTEHPTPFRLAVAIDWPSWCKPPELARPLSATGDDNDDEPIIVQTEADKSHGLPVRQSQSFGTATFRPLRVPPSKSLHARSLLLYCQPVLQA